MQKPLPRQTPHALNPPANVLEPYTFFEAVQEHPLQALDTALNLRNANGTNFDPSSYNTFRSWLLSATATNMAYMLSAQLAATSLGLTRSIAGDSQCLPSNACW